MDMRLSERDVVQAQICEDQDGEWGLYIVPLGPEICITEAELRAALQAIEGARD